MLTFISYCFQSYKAPTSVLIKANGEFVAFGYEAEQQYSEALGGDDDKEGAAASVGDRLLLFRHFKMMLSEVEVWAAFLESAL